MFALSIRFESLGKVFEEKREWLVVWNLLDLNGFR